MQRALTARETIRSRGGRVTIVGHRGAMGYCPENTLVSFATGVQMGADWLEMDVQLTRDGQLVVFHDERVDRTTNGAGYVKDHTLAEITALDAGSFFDSNYAAERVPSFDDVLAWMRTQPVMAMVEIKNGEVTYEGIEQAVVDALNRSGMRERALVISFDHPAVQRVRSLDAELATGILYVGRPVDAVALAREADADALLPQWALVRRGDVEAAHQAGLGVMPWVTSDPVVMRRLVDMGVDSITSNHPDVLRDLLAG